MNKKKPMIKESVGSLYYAFNTPSVGGEFDSSIYEATVQSDVVKSIGTTENAESTTVKASGKDYKTVSQSSSVDLAVEVVAVDPADLAKMRAEFKNTNGLMASGRTAERPYFAFGKVVKKVGDGYRYDWYPKCQLIENTDEIATKEDSFNEQNDTLTIRAFAFNDEGDFKNYIDSEIVIPVGLTEELYFTKPIITAADLDAILVTQGA